MTSHPHDGGTPVTADATEAPRDDAPAADAEPSPAQQPHAVPETTGDATRTARDVNAVMDEIDNGLGE
ncbi:hypothetical protein [Marisediminicola senii]|uniref:hypothetical protein n=1 Tax=Marisediminicola senii TaxID=2711233 RepID=UPI0013EA63BD|nr:hypothetical protein [Marisediminicola senii]